MTNNYLNTFDDFIRGALFEFHHNVDQEECLRRLLADDIATESKLETIYDLGRRLQDYQETMEGISNDDPNWVYAEDIYWGFPQLFWTCIVIGKQLANEVRETLKEAELQEILDDAELQRKTLHNICQQNRIKERLKEAIAEYKERLRKKAAADTLKAFKGKRRKRIRNLFKSVLTSILLSVALSLIIRVASFELLKTPRNNYKP